MRDFLHAACGPRGRRAARRAGPFAGARPQHLGQRRRQTRSARRSAHLRLPRPRQVRTPAPCATPRSCLRAISRNCSITCSGRRGRAAARWGLRGAGVCRRLPAAHAGLCLIDTTAWYGADAPKQWRERAATAQAKGMAALVDFQVTRWFGDAFRATHPDTVNALTRVFLAKRPQCYQATANAWRRRSAASVLLDHGADPAWSGRGLAAPVAMPKPAPGHQRIGTQIFPGQAYHAMRSARGCGNRDPETGNPEREQRDDGGQRKEAPLLDMHAHHVGQPVVDRIASEGGAMASASLKRTRRHALGSRRPLDRHAAAADAGRR